MRAIKDCRVIAHRGASSYFPENTMSAFMKAFEMKAHMIELDVTFTRDFVPVVIHDETVNRTTSGRGRVSDYSYSELRQLDAGKWKSRKFMNEKIPSLQEVLEYCSGRIPVNIEIKTESVRDEISGGIEEAVLSLVNANGMNDNVIISSFDPRALLHLNDIGSTVASASLYEKHVLKGKTPPEICSWLQCRAFNCSSKELTDEWIRACAERGISVNVYTVDSPSKMKKLYTRGVNGIFSNKPDVLLEVFDSLSV